MKELTNEDILKTPSSLLTNLDKQRKYCLEQALAQSPCPDCKTKQNVFEASKTTVNEYTFGVDDLKYTCIKCSRVLKWHLPMFGPAVWFWVLE